ncbi:MAG: FlaD/FlaE family flagellar protein [Haloarculaceae archaeon]
MTINPRDYDLNELREMARKRGDDGEDVRPGDPAEVEWGALEGGDASPAAGDSLRSGLYRELLPLVGATDDLEKPYLEGVPDSYAAEFVVFEWLEFLLLHAGYQGATDALYYYESIGWITEDVAARLDDYLRGIDDTSAGESTELDVDDHMLSLVYVAKLVGMQ